jgi:adenylate kinase
MTARAPPHARAAGRRQGHAGAALVQKLGVPQISTGEMLRDAVAAKTAVGLRRRR